MGRGDLFAYGIFTLIYVLLGLGLNVVVGYAGLLDLGYAAFFGFGAYFYALVSSEHYGIHWSALVSIPIIVVSTALLGLLLGIPSRRLLGDYLAIVTLFFGQAFVVFVLAANPTVAGKGLTGGPERHRRHRPADVLRLRAHEQDAAVLLPAPGRHARARRAALHQRVPHRPRVARPPRGSARGRGDERAGQPAQADGVRVRRRDRGPHRVHLRGRPDGRQPGELRAAAPDHDLRDRDSRRHRQPDRRDPRRGRDQRLVPVSRAREPAGPSPPALLRRPPAAAGGRPSALVAARCRPGRRRRARRRHAGDRRRRGAVVDRWARRSKAVGWAASSSSGC